MVPLLHIEGHRKKLLEQRKLQCLGTEYNLVVLNLLLIEEKVKPKSMHLSCGHRISHTECPYNPDLLQQDFMSWGKVISRRDGKNWRGSKADWGSLPYHFHPYFFLPLFLSLLLPPSILSFLPFSQNSWGACYVLSIGLNAKKI